MPTIGQPGDSAGKESLKLASIPPLAAMLVTGLTQTSKPQPGTQNGTTSFPQQLSLFVAGEITPHIGMFTQFTYAAADGAIGIDNIDLRWAKHTTLAKNDVIVGLTINNNPTVQDVWNTAPAWSYPFMSSDVAPSPAASTLIDGGLGQQVAGVGAYSLYNNMLYTEVAAYRSAPQGADEPLGSTATNATKGVIPYWRVALQHAWPSVYGMIGTYGFAARLYPAGVTGPTNNYTDAAIDAQLEHQSGAGMWIGRAAFIHEQQTLSAFASAAPPEATQVHETLSTFRTNVSFEPSLRYNLTAGYFQTTGTSDAILFAPAPVTGSGSGSPNSRGGIGEIAVNPWQNIRFGLQYVAYTLFNGASNNYDAAGRKASDNNALFAYLWLAF
ncbi:MAG: cytochrome C [Gemmatimonadaceae bacterium]